MSSSSSTALIAPKHPIAIRLDFVAIERTTILIQQKAGWTYGDRKTWLSLTRHFWLELPGGEDILTVQQKWSFGNTKIDFTFRNAASDQEDVVLELRGDDIRNTVAHISYMANMFALIRRKTDQSHPLSYKFLPEYEVDVAEGVGVALVMDFFGLALAGDSWKVFHRLTLE
ncbi:MAG: hypothetical protein LQ346_008047 [Caloplaca aetnensis]|nr:MAG: hypothetical protein LQ346_008047 [Caloplaca aetnensis]